MKEYFEKAIQRMKSLKEIVSEKEWNYIAKEFARVGRKGGGT